MKRLVLIMLLFMLSLLAVWGENIRGPFKGEVLLDNSGQFTDELRLKLEDIGAVFLDRDSSEFLQALEIEVKIPNAVRKYRDSFALFFYRDIEPAPATDRTMYRGEQLSYEVIPSRNVIYYRLPVTSDITFQSSPDTRILKQIIRVEQMPLLITVLPVMKGIPSFLSSSEFRIRGRAIFEEIGYLLLNIAHPDEASAEPFTIMIDGRSVRYPEGKIPLAVGMHTLSLTSSAYKPVTRTIGIETGRESVLDILLENQVPMIYLEKPSGTVIFIDGEKIDAPTGTGLELPEGEHTLLFKLGDYSLSKKVYIERGKQYDISLFMDIVISEKE